MTSSGHRPFRSLQDEARDCVQAKLDVYLNERHEPGSNASPGATCVFATDTPPHNRWLQPADSMMLKPHATTRPSVARHATEGLPVDELSGKAYPGRQARTNDLSAGAVFFEHAGIVCQMRGVRVGLPNMSLYQLCEWLQNTAFGTSLRESIWMFIIVESIHVLGLSLSVGTLLWFDLRLAGIALMDQPASKVMATLMPWSLVGFAIMFLTGVLLFWCQALKAYNSIFFSIKLAFLLLAGINALVFQLTAYKRITKWDKDPVPPLQARIASWVSILLWIGVIVAGRTMAYTF